MFIITLPGAGTFISKTEIPAFIPRQDLMEQLLRWAQFASMDPTEVAKYGLPTRVEPYYKEEGVLWGLIISIVRDGEPATELGIRLDEEEIERHEWVGRGADGFPSLEGKVVSVTGRHLEIRCVVWVCSCVQVHEGPWWLSAFALATCRKIDSNPVDESVRACVRAICEDLVAAINKYYAFGSAFSDDAT